MRERERVEHERRDGREKAAHVHLDALFTFYLLKFHQPCRCIAEAIELDAHAIHEC